MNYLEEVFKMNEVNPIRSKEQINEVIKYFIDFNKYREGFIFVVGIYTGLRISDILQLTHEDIQKGHVTIKEKKTGKTKKFPINAQVKEYYDNYIENGAGEIFVSSSNRSRGRVWSTVHAWKIINEAAQFVGIEGEVGTHTMRKTFGYFVFQKTKDIALVQKLLNHSSPAVTLRYIGITQTQMDEVYLNLNFAF